MYWLREIGRAALHLCYPVLCEGCRAALLPGELLLCTECQMELGRTNYHDDPYNETAARLAGRVALAHATSMACFTSDSLIQHLIHLLKYKGRKDVGAALGRLFAMELQEAEWIQDIQCIVPVPLHPAKERLRGYNQSAVLGEAMAAELRIPHLPHALRRLRHTESQTRKTRAERADNVQSLFEVPAPKRLAGRHVLLLDDVLTTGATLEQAASALQAVPGLKLSIATLAIAMS